MKSWLFQGMLAAAIALPALSGVALAQSTDNDGCTERHATGGLRFRCHRMELISRPIRGPEFPSSGSGGLTVGAVSHRLITPQTGF